MSPLAKQEKELLLHLARQSIQKQVGQADFQIQEVREENLRRPSGAFVTLHRGEELRGCIGRIRSEDPLYQVVQEMAVAAATKDPRFHPVQSQEVGLLRIEISVLSPPQVLQDYKKIEVGVHGLIVSHGWQSGLLLPQVATEYGWDPETFLSHTCMKAGLPGDFWRHGAPVVEFFSAEVFSEAEMTEKKEL